MSVQITELKSGLRVATDYMSTVETATVGAWITVGTRHEKPELNGISHLLEHLAFKGTKKRSAFSIVEEIEAVGGLLNAYTSRENTAYYAKVLKEDIPLAVDIISDILQNATIENSELERERRVVIQEINQSKDTPDDIIFDHFQETAYPNQAIGRPILGKSNLIEILNRQTILNYMKSQYSASRIVIAAAGNVEHTHLVELADQAFCHLPNKNVKISEPITYQGGCYKENRDLEQVHIIMGFDGVSYRDSYYHPMSILSTMLGGGMSSRLFQEVREKRGLAYSIYSFASSFDDGGILGIYAGTGEDEAKELLTIIYSEIQKLTEKISEEELARARAQLKAQTLMNLESTISRSEQIARQLQIFDRIIPIAEIIQNIENVDTEAINETASRVLKSELTLAALGPIKNLEDFEAIKERFN